MSLVPTPIVRATTIAATALLLAACATVSEPEPSWQDKLATSGWKLGPELDSVTSFAVSNFDALDDRHVVLHLGTARRVLVTAGPGCFGLDETRRITWKSFGSMLHRFDELRVRQPGMPASTCRVESIHQLLPPAKG